MVVPKKTILLLVKHIHGCMQANAQTHKHAQKEPVFTDIVRPAKNFGFSFLTDVSPYILTVWKILSFSMAFLFCAYCALGGKENPKFCWRNRSHGATMCRRKNKPNLSWKDCRHKSWARKTKITRGVCIKILFSLSAVIHKHFWTLFFFFCITYVCFGNVVCRGNRDLVLGKHSNPNVESDDMKSWNIRRTKGWESTKRNETKLSMGIPWVLIWRATSSCLVPTTTSLL